MPCPIIACIGGAHLDRRAMLRGPAVPGTSNPATVFNGLGGVARNVAFNLALLGCRVIPALPAAAITVESAGSTALQLTPEALHARA